MDDLINFMTNEIFLRNYAYMDLHYRQHAEDEEKQRNAKKIVYYDTKTAFLDVIDLTLQVLRVNPHKLSHMFQSGIVQCILTVIRGPIGKRSSNTLTTESVDKWVNIIQLFREKSERD